MELATLLGWIATFLFSIMLIPQMIKTVKLKDSKGVSLSLFIIYLIANIIAIVYATLITQPPLIIKYSIAILTTIIYVALYFKYRSKERPFSQESI